ncbi:MAG: hypothetical protein Kow0063_34960 [Anaerolineae bacterium]
MLLTNRRWGLLYFCLAGMEIAWITPFFLLLYRPLSGMSPVLVFVGLFGTLLTFMLVLDILNFLQVDWPFYELAVVGLILVSSLLFVRFWLYGSLPPGDLRWLGNSLGALFDFHQGIRPELILLLTSVLLWQRAANATSRDVGFFGVGLSFRLGLLLIILGAGLLNFTGGRDVRPILWLFLALGLTAVALARAYEKAADARSIGALPSLRRMGQLLLAVGATVGAAALVSLFYTPDRIKATLLVWLKPFGILLGPLLRILLQLLFIVLQPLFLGLEWLLKRLLQNVDWTFIGEMLDSLRLGFETEEMTEPTREIFSGLPPWVWAVLRYLFILLALIVLLGLVLLFLNRVRDRRDRAETEQESSETITLGGATLGRGLRWLRDMAGLVRRFGLSRQLLAAISVQNIYANLCRLARQRGYPRHLAQPPDIYLPVLAQAFPGQMEALARITAAYMQVHYGDLPVTAAELAQLREDYQRVRQAPPVSSTPRA